MPPEEDSIGPDIPPLPVPEPSGDSIFARLRRWEGHWRKSPLGYVFICIALGFAAYWALRPPSPNYALIAMAVMAGLMTLRPEMSGWERSLWAAILIVFAIIEVNAIHKDNVERDLKRSSADQALAASFQKIGEGISASITASQNQFKATMGRTESVLTSITGGNSYAVVMPMVRTGRSDQGLALAAENHGDKILTGVSATLYDTGLWIAFTHESIIKSVNSRIPIGTLHPGERLVLGTQINPEQFMRMDEGESHPFRVFIFITAQNYTFQEYLDFKKGTDGFWLYRYKLFRQSPIVNGTHYVKPPMRAPRLIEAADWSSDANHPVRIKKPNWN